MESNDPYQRQQNRIQKLFDEASSSESSQDPYADDGEYGSDQCYVPSDEDNCSSSDSETVVRVHQPNKSRRRVGGSSDSSKSSTDLSDVPDQNLSQSEHQTEQESQQNENVQPSTSRTEIERDLLVLTHNSQSNSNNEPNNDDFDSQDWSSTLVDIPEFNFDSSIEGISVNKENVNNPRDMFDIVFPKHFVDYIVQCTNAYGNKLCSTNRPHTRNSRRAVFRETNNEEILKFLGLCLLKGHVKCPKQRNLFTYTNHLYYHPIFTYVMSARRHEQLLRCLYASEVDAKGSRKITPFIDTATAHFQKIYNAGKNLSLDESLLLFRGRLQFRQYIKSKKARYGIKFYELTTSDGYVLNIYMYCGKENLEENISKTEDLVLRLMRPYLLKGHHLYMDNFYNSVSLCKKLLGLRTHTVGTLRSNRKGNPDSIVKKKLKKGEHVWVRKNNVYVSKWRDSRPVLMISTNTHPTMVEVQNRFGRKKMKPLEVATYNNHMSGIDRLDQMVSYYSSPRKTIRWYKKVLFHLLDISVWNAYFLYKKYKKNNDKSYEFIMFREELIKDLIKLDTNINVKDLVNKKSMHYNRLHNNIPAIERNERSLDRMKGHWPERIESNPGSKKKYAFLKCRVCSKDGKRVETSYRCKGCPQKPPLCPSCFEAWHNEINL